jgi:hypothetical protein
MLWLFPALRLALAAIEIPLEINSPINPNPESDILSLIQTIALTNVSNLQYKGTLYLGNPRQKIELIFDTASSWLWVPSYH